MPEIMLYWVIFINDGHPELMMIDSLKRIRWLQQAALLLSRVYRAA